MSLLAIKTKPGERIGFGIHFNPDVVNKPEFSDKDQQLVLCFVTLDVEIIFFKIMIQPPGGFYPLVILCRNGKLFGIFRLQYSRSPGPEVIKPFSCSSQMSIKFSMLINVKMPTIVGIFTFISMINTTFVRLKVRKVCIFFSHF